MDGMEHKPECASDHGVVEFSAARAWCSRCLGTHPISGRQEFNGPVTCGLRLKVCMEAGPVRATVVVGRDTVLVVSAAPEGT